MHKLKNVKNTHGGVFLLVILQASAPLWVFFTFFKLHKWYQIAQSTTNLHPLSTFIEFLSYKIYTSIFSGLIFQPVILNCGESSKVSNEEIWCYSTVTLTTGSQLRIGESHFRFFDHSHVRGYEFDC